MEKKGNKLFFFLDHLSAAVRGALLSHKGHFQAFLTTKLIYSFYSQKGLILNS